MTLWENWKDRLGHHAMTWSGWYRKQEQPFSLETYFSELAAIGYRYAEIGSSSGTPAEIHQAQTTYGITVSAVATVVTLNIHEPNTQKYQADMQFAAELGVKTMMVCGGFPSGKRRSIFESEYREFAENLRIATEYAQGHGLRLAFHPHLNCAVETAAELERVLCIYPALDLCIDTGHLIAASSDPNALVRKYPDKIAHVHLKDWRVDEEAFCEIGDGSASLDFPDFFRALDEVNYAGSVIVERDDSPYPPKESGQKSWDGIQRLLS